MKKTFLFFFLLFFIVRVSQGGAHFDKADFGCETDTCLVNKLNEIYSSIAENNTDSALQTMVFNLRLARSIEYSKGEIRALTLMAESYGLVPDFDKAEQYLDTALTLALLNEDKENLANIYNLRGNFRSDKGRYDESISYYEKVLSLSNEIGYSKGVAKAHTNMGVSHYYKGNYAKAIESYNKALPILESLNDSLGLSIVLGNLAVFYEINKQYELAIEANKNALSYLEAEDLRGRAALYSNIGNNYKVLKDYKLAAKYYKISVEISEKLNDPKQLLMATLNLGMTYVYQDLFLKGIKDIHKALELAKVNGFTSEIAQIKYHLSTAYYKEGDYENAEKFCSKSIEDSKAIELRKYLSHNYFLMGQITEDIGKFKASSKFYLKYIWLNDSINSEDYKNQVAALESSYEAQKKEQQIALLRSDSLYTAVTIENQQTAIEKRDAERNVLLMAGALLLLIIGSVTYAFMQKRRDNKLITAQKLKVEQQKHIIQDKNKDITDSIQYAKGIQRSILPSEEEVKALLTNSFLWFQPKEMVSGDFYWTTTDRGHVYFAACDCTGHGVPGALMSMIGTSLLNEAVAEPNIIRPCDLFEEVRKGFKKALKQKGVKGEQRDGMDAVLCRWDGKKKLEFALAYNPLIYVRNGELFEVKPDKQPVGFHDMGEQPYTHHEMELEEGDTVYIYSDGFQDQFGGPKGKKYKSANMKRFLTSISMLPMEEQKDKLKEEFQSWKGSGEQVDDLLIIGFKA